MLRRRRTHERGVVLLAEHSVGVICTRFLSVRVVLHAARPSQRVAALAVLGRVRVWL